VVSAALIAVGMDRDFRLGVPAARGAFHGNSLRFTKN